MTRFETGEVYAPTPEDAQIFKRNWHRMLRWAETQPDDKLFWRALRNWPGDYLHREGYWHDHTS